MVARAAPGATQTTGQRSSADGVARAGRPAGVWCCVEPYFTVHSTAVCLSVWPAFEHLPRALSETSKPIISVRQAPAGCCAELHRKVCSTHKPSENTARWLPPVRKWKGLPATSKPPKLRTPKDPPKHPRPPMTAARNAARRSTRTPRRNSSRCGSHAPPRRKCRRRAGLAARGAADGLSPRL